MSVVSATIRKSDWVAPALTHSDIDCSPLCPEGQPDHGKATCGTGHGILVWFNNLRRSWCSQWVACCKVGLDRPLIPTAVVANLFRSAKVSRWRAAGRGLGDRRSQRVGGSGDVRRACPNQLPAKIVG